jgi:hypothetical protein
MLNPGHIQKFKSVMDNAFSMELCNWRQDVKHFVSITPLAELFPFNAIDKLSTKGKALQGKNLLIVSLSLLRVFKAILKILYDCRSPQSISARQVAIG